jgi:transcription termination factor NusB
MAKQYKGVLQAINEMDKKIDRCIKNGERINGIDPEILKNAFKEKIEIISNNKVVIK